jgi:hypothetical protein
MQLRRRNGRLESPTPGSQRAQARKMLDVTALRGTARDSGTTGAPRIVEMSEPVSRSLATISGASPADSVQS